MVRLTDRLDMTLDVYRERKTTIQQQPTEILGLVCPLTYSVVRLIDRPEMTIAVYRGCKPTTTSTNTDLYALKLP